MARNFAHKNVISDFTLKESSPTKFVLNLTVKKLQLSLKITTSSEDDRPSFQHEKSQTNLFLHLLLFILIFFLLLFYRH